RPLTSPPRFPYTPLFRSPSSGCEPPEDPRLVELTSRQLQIAELVAKGMTNRQIARNLGLSEWTVVNHLRRVMNKLECPSRVHVRSEEHTSELQSRENLVC